MKQEIKTLLEEYQEDIEQNKNASEASDRGGRAIYWPARGGWGLKLTCTIFSA